MSIHSSTLRWLGLMLAGPCLSYGVTYTVTLDTRVLAAQPAAAPYSLDFQLIGGNPAAPSTVALSRFDFGNGGGVRGAATVIGGASGNMSGTVVLTDSAFRNELVQGFTPSPTAPLTFTVEISGNAGTPIPDSFSIGIMDRSGFGLPTQFFDAFLRIDFTAALTPLAYASDPTTPPPGCPTCPPINLPAPTVQQVSDKIVFSSNRSGNFEIYTMNADGTGVTRLTNHSGADLFPTWSPDRTKIAFSSDRSGNFEIYSMNADGSSSVRLTVNARIDGGAAWSPDGSKIAFASNRDGNFEIYSMNANGTGLTRLTNNAAADAAPAWSPDGRKIAFTSTRNGSVEIYAMNADGTGVTRLTNHAALDISPAWSPDGSKIAFASNRNGLLNFEIYVMNADGSSPVRLTNNGAVDGEPAWSRDGARIVFSSNRDAILNLEIYVMNADGSNVTKLTTNQAVDSSPQW